MANADTVAGVLPHVHQHDGQPVAELGRIGLHDRQFVPAVRAPRGDEVDPHRAAAQRGEVHRPSAQSLRTSGGAWSPTASPTGGDEGDGAAACDPVARLDDDPAAGPPVAAAGARRGTRGGRRSGRGAAAEPCGEAATPWRWRQFGGEQDHDGEDDERDDGAREGAEDDRGTHRGRVYAACRPAGAWPAATIPVPMEQRGLGHYLRQLERHLVSSLLTGVGVTLLAAGLFAYVMPFGAAATAPASAPPATPGRASSPRPRRRRPGQADRPRRPGLPLPERPPPGRPPPGRPPERLQRVATRVSIPALRIDLPVVSGNGRFPLCNVAQYLTLQGLPFHPVQPGQTGTTYIYAHARAGMFLPLLTASQVNNGSGMVGYSVLVYTSDSKVYWYSISVVRRGVVPGSSGEWSIAIAPPGVRQLVLQTSEGPNDSSSKLEILAKFELVQQATLAAAHPTPHPQVCT